MLVTNNIFNYRLVSTGDNEEVVSAILDEWVTSKSYRIVNYLYYANFIYSRHNNDYSSALRLSNYILLDGIGMQLYFKTVLQKKTSNLNGTDLNPIFLSELAKRRIDIAMFGTTRERIKDCAFKYEKDYTPNNVYYYQDGFSSFQWQNIRQNSVLFIGLGSPRQEIWIYQNIDRIQSNNLLVISVGGFFDFYCGHYTRAPYLVKRLRMEWLWRFFLNPTKHFKKNLWNLTILWTLIIDRFFIKRD